ncbi:hypothetical protein CAPTEDRAFT_200655 [Capitella teleta]|uniref:SAM domain-containing protein n=1 Tax=Capitella teleta TaxID=283909 RepID=R7U2P8_CAPTE|nr:hypothetical protein CAPTEDRAFT_200655 [Capitella teleta]|eukprot:ELU00153.1 hypothetical protein CAPTEDRAFT_200655 [Capitella teleta]
MSQCHPQMLANLMEFSPDPEDITFISLWAKTYGLSSKSCDVLKHHGIDTGDIILNLHQDDINSLEIPLGQKCLFRGAILQYRECRAKVDAEIGLKCAGNQADEKGVVKVSPLTICPISRKTKQMARKQGTSGISNCMTLAETILKRRAEVHVKSTAANSSVSVSIAQPSPAQNSLTQSRVTASELSITLTHEKGESADHERALEDEIMKSAEPDKVCEKPKATGVDDILNDFEMSLFTPDELDLINSIQSKEKKKTKKSKKKKKKKKKKKEQEDDDSKTMVSEEELQWILKKDLNDLII